MIKSKRTRNNKRILSVKIKRMIDTDPDTSYLGEYSNHAESEFSIDRAHSEDCESLTPDFKANADDEWSNWNASATDILERVRFYLEENPPTACTHSEYWNECVLCIAEESHQQAIDAIWELEKSAGECDCGGRHCSTREYRYFNPSFNYVDKHGKPMDGLTPDDVRKYTRQDYERMESLNAGHWCYIGIRAEADIITNAHANRRNDTPDVIRWHGTIQHISSGGLWGIESDSDKSYIESVEQEELANLKTELLALGFSRRAISQAFKSIDEVSD